MQTNVVIIWGTAEYARVWNAVDDIFDKSGIKVFHSLYGAKTNPYIMNAADLVLINFPTHFPGGNKGLLSKVLHLINPEAKVILWTDEVVEDDDRINRIFPRSFDERDLQEVFEE